LKYNLDNTISIDLDKPIYYFNPSSSSSAEKQCYSKKFNITYYNHTTKTYSLSYNAFDSYSISLNNGNIINVRKNFLEKTGIIDTVNQKINVYFSSYDYLTRTFTTEPTQEFYVTFLTPGMLVRGRNYLTNSDYIFEVESVDANTGTIVATTDVIGYNFLNYDSSFEVNSITLQSELWGESYTVPNSSIEFNFTTSPLITSYTEGIKVNEELPFKNNKWNLSNGKLDLTQKAKRNKFYVKSYDHTTKTYILTSYLQPTNIDYTNLYTNLNTRLYRYNKYKDITISNVNTAANTFTTTTDVWSASYTVPFSGFFRSYVLDEMLTIGDDTSGTWKLFPKTLQNSFFTNDLNTVVSGLSSTGFLPLVDNNNPGYSVPFSLYIDKTSFKYRYILSAAPGTPQYKYGPRSIYSKRFAFSDFTFNTISLSCYSILRSIVDTNEIEVLNAFYFTNKFYLNQSVYNYQLITSAYSPYRVNYDDYDNELNVVSSLVIPPLSTDTFTINYSDFSSLPAGSTFGKKITVTSRHIFIIDEFEKKIHVYVNSPIITPVALFSLPNTVNDFEFNSIINFARSIDSINFNDGSYLALSLTYDKTNNPGNFYDGVAVFRIQQNYSVELIYFIDSANIFHTSVPNSISNNIENISLAKTQDQRTSKFSKIILYVSRPYNTYFTANSGIVDIFEPIYYKNISQTLTNNLPNYYFGSKIAANHNMLAITLSSSTLPNKVSLYNLSAYSTGNVTATGNTTVCYATAYKVYELSGNNNFGKIVKVFDQLSYDPYYVYRNFNYDVLTTDRLYITDSNNIYVYEKFINTFLTLTAIPGQYNTIDIGFNTFVTTSANKNLFYSLSY
jgi:hypothetical protein